MSTFARFGPGHATLLRNTVLTLGAGLLIGLGLLGPRAVPLAQVALWYLNGGPPLDFTLPHDGQVVVHIDVLGRVPPDIARIRITDVSTGAAVWDVKPTTARSECWNGCWNLTLKSGPNPAAFTAGHQQFIASVPRDESFVLQPGAAYLFEVWDSKGRVEHERFTL